MYGFDLAIWRISEMEEKDRELVAAGADNYIYHDDDDNPLFFVKFGLHWASAVDYPNFTTLWATIGTCGFAKCWLLWAKDLLKKQLPKKLGTSLLFY